MMQENLIFSSLKIKKISDLRPRLPPASPNSKREREVGFEGEIALCERSTGRSDCEGRVLRGMRRLLSGKGDRGFEG